MAAQRFSRVLPISSDQDEFISNLLDQDLSDLDDLSDDECFDPSFVVGQQPDCSPARLESEEEDDAADNSNHQNVDNWIETPVFEPLPPAPPIDDTHTMGLVNPIDSFYRYLDHSIFNEMATATSQNILASSGKIFPIDSIKMRKFFGMNIMMSYYKFPRIRMYWAAKSCVAQIADVMPRNDFFLIRNHLRCHDYNSVSQVDKENNKFWKIAPMVNSIRKACLQNPRSESSSIDEQMIPFWGHTSARQYIRGKPNPCGLKNFVCTATDGLPLDFFLYEGKGHTIIDSDISLDIGGKVVLRLIETLPPGANVYIDRYFTSIPLLDELHVRGHQGTGTLQKSRVPGKCELTTDANMRRKGRGSHVQLVRHDGQVAVIKWFDNKPIILASSIHGVEPIGNVQRYSKSERKYITVTRPNLVAEYNQKMGGVDFLDRMISYYRINARTKKWTIRTMFHFIDFVCAAGWIERRRAEKIEHVPKRDYFDLFDFKVDIAYGLINSVSQDFLETDDRLLDEPGPSKRRKPNPMPHDSLRSSGALHLPEIPKGSKLSRCRFPGCSNQKCRFMCTTCKVFLCLNNNRNCFKAFHEL